MVINTHTDKKTPSFTKAVKERYARKHPITQLPHYTRTIATANQVPLPALSSVHAHTGTETQSHLDTHPPHNLPFSAGSPTHPVQARGSGHAGLNPGLRATSPTPLSVLAAPLRSTCNESNTAAPTAPWGGLLQPARRSHPLLGRKSSSRGREHRA